MNLSHPRPQPYHHGDLRNALVEAAVGLAREGGPSAIVLREAARRVGVSPTAAYRHFHDLPDLVGAVAVESLRLLATTMEAELARCAPGTHSIGLAFDRVRAIGRGYLQFALAEPGLFATAFHQHLDEDEMTRATGSLGLSPYELLLHSLDDLIAAGGLAASDRDAAATTAWAATHGLSVLLLGPMADVPLTEREAMIEATLELVGRGIIARD